MCYYTYSLYSYTLPFHDEKYSWSVHCNPYRLHWLIAYSDSFILSQENISPLMLYDYDCMSLHFNLKEKISET